MQKPIKGYTYFGVLFVLTLVALALTGAALLWQVQQQRVKEKQLLFIGAQYVKAIGSYYHSAPGGFKKYPTTLNELLLDTRFPTIKRHLRKPWLDPFTNQSDWGLVRTKQGGIAGIYSKTIGIPIKRVGFGSELRDMLLANKNSYADWKFIYIAAIDDQQYEEPSASEPEQDTGQQDTKTQSDNAENNASDKSADEAEEEDGSEFIPIASDMDLDKTLKATPQNKTNRPAKPSRL